MYIFTGIYSGTRIDMSTNVIIMTKFEYKVIYVGASEDPETTLNHMGGKGWKLISVIRHDIIYSDSQLYFCREICEYTKP